MTTLHGHKNKNKRKKLKQNIDKQRKSRKEAGKTVILMSVFSEKDL